MKLSKIKLAILTVLASSEYAISSNEIVGSAQSTHNIALISHYLEILKEYGLVENGISEVVNRKTVLTWKITDNGRAVIGSEKGKTAEAEAIDEPTALLRSVENLEEKIIVLRKLSGVVPDEWVGLLNEIIVDLSS